MANDITQAAGRIDARGAMLGDFEVVGAMPPNGVAVAIERDRPYFVARPGFYRKLIPLRREADGTIFSGGRYLFRTYADTVDFVRWFRDEFRLDEKLFIECEWVKNFTRLTFHVLGAHDFADIHDSQIVVRAQRWALDGERGGALEAAWPAIRERAAEARLASVWLLFSDERQEAALITVADRAAKRDLSTPDFASLAALEARSSVAAEIDRQDWARRNFDRTSWVFTIWFPPSHEPLHLWPNSPPLPGLEPFDAAQGRAMAK